MISKYTRNADMASKPTTTKKNISCEISATAKKATSIQIKMPNNA